MYRRILLIAMTGLLFTTASAKTFQMVEGAYETELGLVTLPGSIAGTLILRTCDECDPHSLQVQSGTVYVGANGAMPLADFRQYVAEIRQVAGANQTTAVAVFYDLETNRVTRVGVHVDAI